MDFGECLLLFLLKLFMHYFRFNQTPYDEFTTHNSCFGNPGFHWKLLLFAAKAAHLDLNEMW